MANHTERKHTHRPPPTAREHKAGPGKTKTKEKGLKFKGKSHIPFRGTTMGRKADFLSRSQIVNHRVMYWESNSA